MRSLFSSWGYVHGERGKAQQNALKDLLKQLESAKGGRTANLSQTAIEGKIIAGETAISGRVPNLPQSATGGERIARTAEVGGVLLKTTQYLVYSDRNSV